MNEQTHPDGKSRSEDSGADAGKEISLLDLGVVLAENLRLLALLPLLAGLAALGATYLVTPKFTSTTTMLVPQQQQGAAAMALLGQLSGGLTGGLSAAAGLKNPADQWVGLLKSRTVADAIVERFKLRERYDADFQFEAREELAARTTVSTGKDGLIAVSVEDPDPATAAKMATAYTAELQKLSASMALTEAAQRRVFYEQRLLDAKNDLTKAEQALQQSGVGEGVLKVQPEAAVELLARLKAEIVALEVQISVMRGYLADGSPELRQAQTQLASLQRQLAKAEQDNVGAKAGGSDYVARYRDFKYYEKLYELVARQYEIARVDEAQEGALVQVVDAAQVPEWKSKPKRGLIAIAAAVASLLAGVVFVFVRNAFRQALKDPTQAPKLAQISARLWGRARKG